MKLNLITIILLCLCFASLAAGCTRLVATSQTGSSGATIPHALQGSLDVSSCGVDDDSIELLKQEAQCLKAVFLKTLGRPFDLYLLQVVKDPAINNRSVFGNDAYRAYLFRADAQTDYTVYI